MAANAVNWRVHAQDLQKFVKVPQKTLKDLLICRPKCTIYATKGAIFFIECTICSLNGALNWKFS